MAYKISSAAFKNEIQLYSKTKSPLSGIRLIVVVVVVEQTKYSHKTIHGTFQSNKSDMVYLLVEYRSELYLYGRCLWEKND